MATRTIANGGGNWNSTGTWVEGAVPTNADDVVATATSGQVTITAAAACHSADFTNYTNTLTHNAFTLSIGSSSAGGSLTFVSGMTYTPASGATISFVSNATGGTLTSAGKTLDTLTIAGTGASGVTTLQDNLTVTGILTLTRGKLDVNGNTLNIGGFSSSGTLSRTLTLTNSTVNCSGDWNSQTVTNWTLTVTGSTLNMTGTGATFDTGNKTYNNLTFSATGAQICGLTAAFTCTNLTLTGTSSGYDTLVIGNNITVTGTFTATGNSAVLRHHINTNTGFISGGVSRTITAAAVSLSNVDFTDITGAGAATWSGTSIGDALGNSNITFTTPTTRYWAAAGGNWSDTSRWSATSGGSTGASVPLPQDNVVFDANSFTGNNQTVLVDMPFWGKDITTAATVFTHNMNVMGGTNYSGHIFGSATWSSKTTLNSFLSTIYLRGRSTHTLTWGGATYVAGYSLSINCVTGSYTLQDNLSMGANISLVSGTFDDNNKNVSIGTLVDVFAMTKAVNMGTGTWTFSRTGNLISMNQAGTTLSVNNTNIVISDTSSTSKTWDPPTGKTFGSLSITGGGTGAVSMYSAANTATYSSLTVGAPKTLTFFSGSTTTVTGAISMTGTSGNLITIQSSTAASAATISKSSGVVSCNYLSLKDSAASGGATFYAGANSTNVSGNSGWIFANPPSPGLMLMGIGS